MVLTTITTALVMFGFLAAGIVLVKLAVYRHCTHTSTVYFWQQESAYDR